MARSVARNLPFSDRLYFTAAASLLTLLVIVAFTPSYFLHSLFQRPAPTPFIAFHGLLMTGWLLLLVIQTLLVVCGLHRWHKRLGYVGAAYAAFVVPIGCMATLAAAAREVHGHSRFVAFQLNVLGLELMQMALFGGFVAAATISRHRADQHKRLILMATLCIVPNAIVRLSFLPPFAFLGSNLAILHAWTLLLLGVGTVDALRIRRLHPAYLWSMPLAVFALYSAWAVSLTASWDDFWLRSLV